MQLQPFVLEDEATEWQELLIYESLRHKGQDLGSTCKLFTLGD